MSALTDRSDLLVHGLKDTYDAERHAKKMFAARGRAASPDGLVRLLDERQGRADADVERLEAVFGLLGHEAEAVTCDAMDGIVKEARHLLEDAANAATRTAKDVVNARAA